MKKYVQEYNKITGNYIKAQLFYAALELDIFTYLDEMSSIEELVKKTNYHKENLKWLLLGLASENIVYTENNQFINMDQAKKLLSKNSPYYIGESLLSARDSLGLGNAANLVKNGPSVKAVSQKDEPSELSLQSSWNRAKIFGNKPLIDTLSKVFNPSDVFNFIDVGGGNGALSIELAKRFPNCTGVIFEKQSVAKAAKFFVKQQGLENRIKIISGDFLTDDLGTGYDLILASAIFYYTKHNQDEFILKLYRALKPAGYLYSVTKVTTENYTKPKGFITFWLSNLLNGQDILLNGNELFDKLKRHGFILLEKHTEDEMVKLYQKSQ